MGEWIEYKLGEVASLSTGFPFKGEKYSKEGVRVVRGDNVTIGELRWPEEKDKRWNEPFDRSEEFSLRENDIVIGMDGSRVGYNRAQIKKEDLPLLIAQRVACIRNNEKSLQSFLYYQIFSNRFLSYIRNIQTGSAIPHISLKQIGDFTISLPSLDIQRNIASILSSLDDKIAVNKKICENLEAQAQALFKSWFVDFEPFKDGEFVESELGRIPKGWRVGKLGELCQFKRGKGLLSKNAIPGDVPVVAGGLEPACYHNNSNTKAPVITVSGSGANAGFMRMYHQEVWASDCSFIDITCENWLFVYCFLAINSHLLKHAQTGAVQPHVKPADIHNFDLAIPPKDFIQRFQDKILSFITKKGLLEQESRRLAELRDTLLPRLMSGELKVDEIEKENLSNSTRL